MKVLVLSTALHGGGAEYVARTWAAGLAERGHVVVTATTSEASVQSHKSPLDHISIEVTGFARKVTRLRTVLLSEKFDAVVSLQTFPNLVALAAARAITSAKRPRVYVSERNLVSLGIPGSSLAHRTKVQLARRMYRRANGVIAISHPVAAELVSWFGVPRSKCTVVPNPATAKVAGNLGPRMRCIDLSQEICIVLPARQVKQKQPWLAVRAADELQSRGLKVRVISFGDGPLSDQTRDLAVSLGVDYEAAGWVENWHAVVPRNSVVVLSSLREGFGNVLVECAAVGVPAVALSGALGVADALVPGITGALALRDTPGSVADAVIQCGSIKTSDITGWLERYSTSHSLTALEQVLGESE